MKNPVDIDSRGFLFFVLSEMMVVMLRQAQYDNRYRPCHPEHFEWENPSA
jgi:hypothetical protein